MNSGRNSSSMIIRELYSSQETCMHQNQKQSEFFITQLKRVNLEPSKERINRLLTKPSCIEPILFLQRKHPQFLTEAIELEFYNNELNGICLKELLETIFEMDSKTELTFELLRGAIFLIEHAMLPLKLSYGSNCSTLKFETPSFIFDGEHANRPVGFKMNADFYARNMALLVKHPKQAIQLANAIFSLQNGHYLLINPYLELKTDLRDILSLCPNEAEKIAKGLLMLRANRILDEQNLQLLMRYSDHIEEIVEECFKKKSLTLANFKKIIEGCDLIQNENHIKTSFNYRRFS